MQNNNNKSFNLNVAQQFMFIEQCKQKFMKLNDECQKSSIKYFLKSPYPSSYNAYNQVILGQNSSKYSELKDQYHKSDRHISRQIKTKINSRENLRRFEMNNDLTEQFQDIFGYIFPERGNNSNCQFNDTAIDMYTKYQDKSYNKIFDLCYFGFVEGFFDNIKGKYKSFKNQKLNNKTEGVTRDKAYRLAIQISNKLVMGMNDKKDFNVILESLKQNIKNLAIVTKDYDHLFIATLHKIAELIEENKRQNVATLLEFGNRIINQPKQGFFGRIKRFFTKKPLNQSRLFGGKSRKNRKSRRTHKKTK
jgi:hypothetical protein